MNLFFLFSSRVALQRFLPQTTWTNTITSKNVPCPPPSSRKIQVDVTVVTHDLLAFPDTLVPLELLAWLAFPSDPLLGLPDNEGGIALDFPAHIGIA